MRRRAVIAMRKRDHHRSQRRTDQWRRPRRLRCPDLAIIDRRRLGHLLDPARILEQYVTKEELARELAKLRAEVKLQHDELDARIQNLEATYRAEIQRFEGWVRRRFILLGAISIALSALSFALGGLLLG